MNSKIIEIVYLATGSYKQFAKQFFDSIKLFFPGYKKIITIISDGLEEYKHFSNIISNDIIEINVHKIVQLPYPFISYFKYNYTKEFCSNKADYIFYFDADTVFIENSLEHFGNILKLADSNILLSKHPFYVSEEFECAICTFFDYNTERDPSYCSCIEQEEYEYVIGSFFAGTTKNVMILCDKIVSLITEDLNSSNREWYIPKFMDESYLNSLSIKDLELSFAKEQFSILNGCNNILDFTICKQKKFDIVKEERIID